MLSGGGSTTRGGFLASVDFQNIVYFILEGFRERLDRDSGTMFPDRLSYAEP